MAALETPPAPRRDRGRPSWVIPRWGWRVWRLGRQGDRSAPQPRASSCPTFASWPMPLPAHWRVRPCRGQARSGDGGPCRGAGLHARWPGLGSACSSTAMAYHQAQEWQPLSRVLLAARADLVLGRPSVCHASETWIKRLHRASLALCDGRGRQFESGQTKKRAPSAGWELCQIECVYRLYQNPHRWRADVSLPAFAWACSAQWLSPCCV